MEFIEGSGSKSGEGFLKRMVKGLKELPPINSLFKEREFNSLTKKTAKKLLGDIQEGGFLVGKQYWVYLRNSRGQNFVVIAENRPPKPWQAPIFDIEAADTNFPLDQRQRSARLTLESKFGQHHYPFTSPKWEGDIYCEISAKSPHGTNEEQPLPREEQILLIHEMLISSLDKQSTEAEYNRSQQRSIQATWVKGAEIDIPSPR